MSDKVEGLPVLGYKPQGQSQIEVVNANKRMEEQVLRVMDRMAETSGIDKRWLAIARTDIEKGFMALNRAVFKPGRVSLPEDASDD